MASKPIFAIPIPIAIGIDPWCNGNTTDFGSVIYGSNPYGSTKIPFKEGIFL